MPVIRIAEFDTWKPYYGGLQVTVYQAGTTTKATLYADEALSSALTNPQTLQMLTVDSIDYGKFLQAIYTNEAYYLSISGDTTGIVRPMLTSLADEDASNAEVTPSGGSAANDLDDILGRVIHAEDYGELGAVAATNNTTLTNAIGAAAGAGGGIVVLPAGTYPFTSLTLSAGVILWGQGRDATVLQSQTAGDVITMGGDRAGCVRMTLDGVDLQVGSNGIYSKAVDETIFGDFLVKRFETGIHYKGGRRAAWRDFYIDNCDEGAKLHGDNDAGGGADGDEFRNNSWVGGKVSNCTVRGVHLSFEDKKCYHNTLQDVGFEDNTGTALDVNGARFTRLPGCWWSGNTTDIAVDDDDDTDNSTINTVIGLHFEGGSIDGGAITLTGKCQDVVFESMELADVDITLTLPENNVVALNCIEDSLVTISGQGEKWTRQRTILGDEPGSAGTTSDATATKAWAISLDPGQRGRIEAVVVANQQDGTGYAMYHISRAVHRPGSTLDYDNQTVDFTVGQTLTGATSGATALIIADSDSGSTGTLTLRNISGEFQNNETITDGNGGSATANGTLSHQNAALLGSTTSICAAVETAAGMDAAFAVNADEVEIQVTGEAAKTYEWLVSAKAILT